MIAKLKQQAQDKWQQMSGPMRVMLLSLGVLFGAIFLYKLFGYMMMELYFARNGNPKVTVSTSKVESSIWQSTEHSVGSLRTTMGVNVTAQLTGMIQTIYFTPGMEVKQNDILVQQNASTNIAQLHATQASAELAKITYNRDKLQYKVRAVSKQQLDTDEQNLKNLDAQVAQQQATLDKLTIRAPFTGKLGISNVNPGQFLSPGDSIVTLQSLDPMYVDFYLPQENLSQLRVGQVVTFTADAFPKREFSGKITTINPIVDTDTRNVEVEATLPNPKMELFPGMFVNVQVSMKKPKSYLTVPQTAITFNSYGDIVYIVKDKRKKNDDKPLLTVIPVFVTTGDTRGDQITVLTGLHEGDIVVTSGQLKLKNGSLVEINNAVQPTNNADPTLSNEHEG